MPKSVEPLAAAAASSSIWSFSAAGILLLFSATILAASVIREPLLAESLDITFAYFWRISSSTFVLLLPRASATALAASFCSSGIVSET